MKILDKLSTSRPSFSFEFFPPKDEAGVEQLYATIADLRGYEPAYVSVTWGAGGSTQRLTIELVTHIRQRTGIETMAHLTCVGATRDQIGGWVDQLREAGIDNLLPLRGDPPRGQTQFVKTEGGFGHASELIEFVRGGYDFCLAAACYPETHTEATDAASDLSYLKNKVDAGVDFLITQLFFDNADYLSFVERARNAGIDQPILAGIMPITNVSQVKRFTAMCGARIPGELLARLEAAGTDTDQVKAIGVEHAVLQCRDLLARGAPGIHFYTLNRSPATKQILEALRQT